MIRFVLVNRRTPAREPVHCACCGATLDDGYVHEPETDLKYCDAVCFGYSEGRVVLAFEHLTVAGPTARDPMRNFLLEAQMKEAATLAGCLESALPDFELDVQDFRVTNASEVPAWIEKCRTPHPHRFAIQNDHSAEPSACGGCGQLSAMTP